MEDKAAFFKYIGQTSPLPLGLNIQKAEGIYLFDEQGNKYVDLISGIAVSTLGHGHIDIIEAIKKQADNYIHSMVYGEHILTPQTTLAKLLIEHLPDSFKKVYFVNSGSEAVEGAMKIAKKHTGRYEFVACKNGYHGSTQGAQSLMSNAYYKQGYKPFLPGVRFIDFNDVDSLDMVNNRTAAVILEPIQGGCGINPADPIFLKALRRRCDETGALLIFDEIQTGFGRTGELFAFQMYDIIPDILLLAKAFGGGMPLGAFVASDGIMDAIKDSPMLGYISTFGGHAISCAAGLAALKYLLNSRLMETVQEKELLFRKSLKLPSEMILRGVGLMLALDLGSESKRDALKKYALNQGILMDSFLFETQSLRICPPLTITNGEIIFICDVLNQGLKLI